MTHSVLTPYRAARGQHFYPLRHVARDDEDVRLARHWPHRGCRGAGPGPTSTAGGTAIGGRPTTSFDG